MGMLAPNPNVFPQAHKLLYVHIPTSTPGLSETVEVDEDLQTAARRAVTEETLWMCWSPSSPAAEAEKDKSKHFVHGKVEHYTS